MFILVDLRRESEDYVTNLPKLATTEKKLDCWHVWQLCIFGENSDRVVCQNSRNFNKSGNKTDKICQIELKFFAFELYSSQIHLNKKQIILLIITF